MQRGVAAAMQYLSSFAFVHRALSARSVLVNSHLVCKVARLGHSPQVSSEPSRVNALHQVLGGELEYGMMLQVGYHGSWGLGTRSCSEERDVWSKSN